MTRRHRWLVRVAKAQLILGVILLLVCAASFVWYVLYQQPPGVTLVTQPDGSLITAPPEAGKVRVRLVGGSLIVANGELPWNAKVKVRLGRMVQAGWHVGRVSAPRAVFMDANAWKYHLYPEHMQVQLLPVAGVLILPWFLLTRYRAKWMCQACGYDLRGLAGRPCPECGGGDGEARGAKGHRDEDISVARPM